MIASDKMFIEKLSLTNFRNYLSLDIELPPRLVVLRGDNAQGKSNFLEAIYLLATTRSPRGAAERELINWSALSDEPPVCRLSASVQRANGGLRLEVAWRGKATAPRGERPALYLERRIRVDGLVRRATELVGQINVVMFSAQDIDLVGGEPTLRRRYLDITSSQTDSRYLRNLQRYNRVLVQRNHLLRLIAQGQASPDELAFWDRELVDAGSYLITQRGHLVAALNQLAQVVHHELSGGQEELGLAYRRSIGNETEPNSDQGVKDAFSQALKSARSKELAQGMSLVGPHRDDLRFLVNGMDMGVYGSRGQQRTVALSLRLAEARFMRAKTGDPPLLLLDDVLSELDAQRRCHLLDSASGYQQVLITTTDLDHFPPGFLAQAMLFEVKGGGIKRIQP